MIEQADELIIDNHEAAKILLRVSPADYLGPFFKEPTSLSEAAKRYEVEISKYYYWVKKYRQFGLLKIAYERKRKGKSIKYYLTTAKQFIVLIGQDLSVLREYYSHAVKTYSDLIIDGQISALAQTGKQLALSLTVDQVNTINTRIELLEKDDSRVNIMDALIKSDLPAAFTTWYHMPLKYEDAKEMQKRLRDLFLEYHKKSEAKQSGYLINLAFVPYGP